MKKATYTLGSLALALVSFIAALRVPSEPNKGYEFMANTWEEYSSQGSMFFVFVGILWVGVGVLALTSKSK
jgi:hypothetical protein